MSAEGIEREGATLRPGPEVRPGCRCKSCEAARLPEPEYCPPGGGCRGHVLAVLLGACVVACGVVLVKLMGGEL